jgi:hypothetical protein
VLAVIAVPALIGFYFGLIGPLAAIFDLPEEWGFVQTRHVLFDISNKIYRPAVFDILGEQARVTLAEYQSDWASLVASIED